MDKIILDLLKENGRVIIPDFGALIVKQKSPFTVIFNEFLQYNDGALIGAVEKTENIDRDNAAAKTREFTKEIQTKLGKGEEITLTGIGVLTKSATGKISIKEIGAPDEAQKKAEPAKTTPPKKEESKTVEFDLEENKKPADTSTKSKETPKTSTKKDLPGGIPEKKEKKELPKSAPKKEIHRPAAKKELPKSAPIRKEEPVKTVETPPITEYYSEGTGRNKWNIVLWIVVILVVNGAIIGFFFFSDEIKALFGKKTDTIESQIPETTILEEETPVAIDTLTEEKVVEPVIESTPEDNEEQQASHEIFAGTKYYVVAGVFSIEANADNLVTELRKQGYNAEKFAKIGNMHAVSYDVFPTKREADRLMLKIQRDVNAGAWIKIID